MRVILIGTLCAVSDTGGINGRPFSARQLLESIQDNYLSSPQKIQSQENSEARGEFSDAVQTLLQSWEEPDTPWLTRLELDFPRYNVDSLPMSYRRSKRVMDILGALVLGVLLAPVWITFPIVIKLTSGPGPIIFRQTRVGLNNRKRAALATDDSNSADNVVRFGKVDRRTKFAYGKPFTLYKFRTMRNDAEKDGAQFAQANDARVTNLGKFMRKTRIDEIPQLINVLRGEMSLVGPRPERPFFVDQLSKEIPNYLNRLGLRPGLTGIAQIENGYDNDTESFRRKVAYDIQYLQHCSVGNDLKILFRTIHVIVTGKGAL